MNIIGIDPGKNGAIVVLDKLNNVLLSEVMPCIGKEFDIVEMVGCFEEALSFGDAHVFIEDVHAIHGSAAGPTFQFGYVCGAIRSVVCVSRTPYTLVQPKKWQREVYQGIPEMRKPSIKIKTGKRAGQMMRGKVDTKKMSLCAAKRLFPVVDLRKNARCRVAHDGIVDALLIAEYGRRKLYAGTR